MRGGWFWFWLATTIAAPAAAATTTGVPAIDSKAYNELFWAAKWSRWERSCNDKDAVQWFARNYGTRFEALRLKYVSMFAKTPFPELPFELVDGTLVWSCRTGRHSDRERTFVRILRNHEIELGVRNR